MRHRSRIVGSLLAIAVALAGSTGAAAHPPKPAKPAPAHSVGSPNEGKLVGGKRIEPSNTLRVVGGHRWGMPALVGMLERSAARVAKRHAGAVLTVGDLSRKGGGDVDGHRSHESGRDADVGFYLLKKHKPYLPRRFATVGADGRAAGMPGVAFDDARNWELVAAWLNDSQARVLQIFVSRPLRARLLEQAKKSGASAALQARAAAVLIQPRHALPHDNHFHVRIGCSKSETACVDYSTPVPPKPAAVAAARTKHSGKAKARQAAAGAKAGAPPRGTASR